MQLDDAMSLFSEIRSLLVNLKPETVSINDIKANSFTIDVVSDLFTKETKTKRKDLVKKELGKFLTKNKKVKIKFQTMTVSEYEATRIDINKTAKRGKRRRI
jgi:acid stress-induced BolA-like protein IbaG/YrbA